MVLFAVALDYYISRWKAQSSQPLAHRYTGSLTVTQRSAGRTSELSTFVRAIELN